jgi:hypothetical protein
MLPGFRFLLAAIVLSMSVLVFGLGAAALLRAAHEEFAANPTWRAAPEPVFAQQSETTRATLAMLRVDPPPKPPVTATAFAPTEPTAPASGDAQKAVTPAAESPPLSEAAKPDIKQDQDVSADVPPAQAAAPATPVEAATLPQVQVPAETPATQVAAAADTAPAAGEPAPVARSEAPPDAASAAGSATTTEPAAPVTNKTAIVAVTEAAPTHPAVTDSVQAPKDQASKEQGSKEPAAKKVATLADTSAKTDESEQAKAADAKAEQKARLRAERAKERRRLAAQRARIARQASALPTLQFPGQQAVTPQFQPQQPATEPFAQTTPPTPPPPHTKRVARTQ